MMKSIGNAVREVTLASVPNETFGNPKVTDNIGKRAWSARFNVACWLCVRYAIRSPIKLKLLYRDSRGWQRVLVDEGFINPRNRLLLTGAVSISVLGSILEMKVNASGISSLMSVSAEELFVQKIEESQRQKNLFGASATA